MPRPCLHAMLRANPHAGPPQHSAIRSGAPASTEARLWHRAPDPGGTRISNCSHSGMSPTSVWRDGNKVFKSTRKYAGNSSWFNSHARGHVRATSRGFCHPRVFKKYRCVSFFGCEGAMQCFSVPGVAFLAVSLSEKIGDVLLCAYVFHVGPHMCRPLQMRHDIINEWPAYRHRPEGAGLSDWPHDGYSRDSVLMPTLPPSHRMSPHRCQSGPHAGSWLAAIPGGAATTLPPAAMQIAFRCPLRLPLPIAFGRCGPVPGCGQQVDVFEDHSGTTRRLARARGCSLVGQTLWAGRRARP